MFGNKDWFDYLWFIWFYVGCVVIEKNIEVFFKMNVDGMKVVVGDGL